MVVTLSERRFAALIRNLEPATVNDSDEEILERIQTYAARLFKHLSNFGLVMTGLLSQRGGVADFRFAFTNPPYSQGDSREPYIEALNFLNPLCVTVEVTDLSALVPAPGMASIMRDYWSAISESLTKILPNEVIPKLEEAAHAISFQGAAAEAAEVPAVITQAGYDEWAIANGVPLHNSHILKEQRKQAEINAYRERNAERFVEHESDWNVRLPEA